MMLVDSITSNARQDPGRGALQVMNHASGLERSHFTAGCQILIWTSPDGDMSERLRLDTSPAAENLRFQLNLFLWRGVQGVVQANPSQQS
jgi:hypothetical protein